MSFEIPRLRSLARHALPNILEASVVPLVVFYLAMWAFGVWGALAAALAWSYGAIAARLATGRRVPGMLVIGAAGLTARTAIALASKSVFIYFLQPSLGTVMVAGAFLLSVPAGRPLAQKLAADFCPLPEHFAAHPRVKVFFARISLLWGLTFIANAATTIYLLLSQSIGVYMLAKTLTGFALSGTAIAVSVWWFTASMRREGIPVVRAAA